MSATTYEAIGPLEIPADALASKPSSSRAQKAAIFDAEVGARRGAFFFCLKTARGLVPVYIGSAPNAFSDDVLTPENRRAFATALLGYRRARPMILLVARPNQRGRVSGEEISSLTATLFTLCATSYPSVQLLGKDGPDWAIQGVLRTGPGRLSRGAQQMRRILGL